MALRDVRGRGDLGRDPVIPGESAMVVAAGWNWLWWVEWSLLRNRGVAGAGRRPVPGAVVGKVAEPSGAGSAPDSTVGNGTPSPVMKANFVTPPAL